ncbi:MAG: phospholipid carrier-dependent glycosyltransferase [Dehalococcoidia bacterium]|nr:MAG: phospholipid carrier-dependent glycosyltransferase [Dehalococcoidia bacterium]
MAKLAQAKPHAASLPADTLARWAARARPLLAEAALPGAIVLLALFLRAYRMELEPWLPDTYEQLTASRNLVHGVFPPSDIYPPGVAVTMAPAMLLLPQTLATMQVVIVVASLITIALCYFAVREATGDRLAATLLALGVALAPRFVYASRTGLYDSISTMWVVGAILLVPALRRRGVVAAALFGVALSIAVSVRGSNGAFLPAVAMYWSGIGTAGVSWRDAARRLGDRRVAAGGAALLIASALLAIMSGWLGQAAGGTPLTVHRLWNHLFFYFGTEFGGTPALFVIAPAAIVGAVEVWRRNRTLLIVALYMMAVWPFAHAPLPFFNARYMLPAVLFGLLLATHAPAALARELDGLRRTPAALTKGAVVGGLLLGGVFFAGVDGRMLYQWHDSPASRTRPARASCGRSWPRCPMGAFSSARRHAACGRATRASSTSTWSTTRSRAATARPTSRRPSMTSSARSTPAAASITCTAAWNTRAIPSRRAGLATRCTSRRCSGGST